MAKKAADGGNVVSFNVSQLTGELRTQVSTLKAPIKEAAGNFLKWRTKCADIAPKVMKLFRAIQGHFDAIPGATTFRLIDFCRMIDPAVPETSAEYNEYSTVKTIKYMKLLDEKASRKSTEGTTQGAGGARSKALDFAARLVKFVQSLPIAGMDPAAMLAQATHEAGFSKNMRTRFAQRVEALDPLWSITLTAGKAIKAELTVVPAKPEPAKTANPMHAAGHAVSEASLESKLAATLASAQKTQRRRSA